MRARRTKLGCLMCPAARRGAARCPPRWKANELVDVRELAGLTTPFYAGAAGPEHAVAFAQLTAPGGFAAKWGFATAGTPWERLVGLSQPVCLYPGSNKL